MKTLLPSRGSESGSSDRASQNADRPVAKQGTNGAETAMSAHGRKVPKAAFATTVVDLDASDTSTIGSQGRSAEDEEARQLELAIQLTLRESRPDPPRARNHAITLGSGSNIGATHAQQRSPYQAVRSAASAIAAKNGGGTTSSPDHVYPRPSPRPQLDPQDSGVDLTSSFTQAPSSAKALRAKRLARFGQGTGFQPRQDLNEQSSYAETTPSVSTSFMPPSNLAKSKPEGAKRAIVVVDLTDDSDT